MTQVVQFLQIVAAILWLTLRPGHSLECYNCYTGEAHYRNEPLDRAAEFIPCNVRNMTESNAWICPHKDSKCVYRKLEFKSTKNRLVWRTCSSGISDPCETKTLLQGVKLLECRFCSTDRCNLMANEDELANSHNTLNINANINLFLRQR